MSFFFPIAAFALAAAGLVAARRYQCAECHSSPVLAAIGAGLLGGVAGGLLAAGCITAAQAHGDRDRSSNIGDLRNEISDLRYETTGRGY